MTFAYGRLLWVVALTIVLDSYYDYFYGFAVYLFGRDRSCPPDPLPDAVSRDRVRGLGESV